MANFRVFKKWITYLILLSSIAIILGTFTFSLIVKSMVIYIRRTGWLVSHEAFILFCIALFLLLFTLLFAKWLTIWFSEPGDTTSKLTFNNLVILSLGICLIYWLPNKEAAFRPTLVSEDHRFTGGPYPDTAKLITLKSEGYTTIISLLDPLLLPSEPFLIKEEEKAVASLGLNLIRIPLLSGKVESLEANKHIEALAKSEANEKYYVHGYRDPDRVLLFLNQVKKFQVVSSKAVPTPGPIIQPAMIVNKGQKTITLEKGMAMQLDNHVIVSPKPTMDEFKRYFLMTPNSFVTLPIHSVVSLNPDENPAQTTELIQLLKSHKIDYYFMPIQLYPYDAQAALKIAKKIKSLSGGVLIYSYYMPPQSTATSAFMLSYLTNLPALPKNLFSEIPMQGGRVKPISPNVAIGPPPAETEFKDYLRMRGIRGIGFAGPCSKESAMDQSLAKNAGLKWVCLQVNDMIVLDRLKKGGPWYVYGPMLSFIEADLTKRMGKFMPKFTPEGN